MRRGSRGLIGCGAVTSQEAARPLVPSKHVPLTITKYRDTSIYIRSFEPPTNNGTLLKTEITPINQTIAMAVRNKYSVLLPTYNERRNLPIIVWLLEQTFKAEYAETPQHKPKPPH
jgi:hypothetical protein